MENYIWCGTKSSYLCRPFNESGSSLMVTGRIKKVQNFENKFGTETLKLLPLQPALKAEQFLKSI
ncbi:hypothetical protein, partial [Filimonas zeae]